MAIPQESLSSTVVEGSFHVPENRRFYALISHERGPIAVEDTTEGLLYQNWTMNWDSNTGVLSVTGETSGITTPVITVANLLSFTFTFDQNARITVAYVTSVSSYLYWYDTAQGTTTTTDIGATAATPAILLDDKRDTQSAVNDMLLWYTRPDGTGTHQLFMLRQRDRFGTEFLMESGLLHPFIHNIGMSSELRIQLALKDTPPNLAYV